MLHINIVRKQYRQKLVLADLNITLHANGLYGVVGKNGAGKTTFFKCLAHSTDFEGDIRLNNEKISAENVAFIPTEPFLYDYLTIGEFHSFYARLIGVSPKPNPLFTIDDSLIIHTLSTGMRKKVYLNAVFQKPYAVYVFDEPFNGLDIESAYQLRKLLLQLSESHIVFVSSHLLESLNDCQSILVVGATTMKRVEREDYSRLESLLFEELAM